MFKENKCYDRTSQSEAYQYIAILFDIETKRTRGTRRTRRRNVCKACSNTVQLRKIVGWVEERSKIPKGNPTFLWFCWVTLREGCAYAKPQSNLRGSGRDESLEITILENGNWEFNHDDEA
jgi:hypothetical protein